jgi:hypothetical protein
LHRTYNRVGLPRDKSAADCFVKDTYYLLIGCLRFKFELVKGLV